MNSYHNKHVFIILNFLESKSVILIISAQFVDKLFLISSEVIPILIY